MTDQVTLTLIRGAPGSGKSTLAELIRRATQKEHDRYEIALVEIDDWRVDAAGIYRYDPQLNREIAGKCLSRTIELLKTGTSVIVCNTFLKMPQVKPYRIAAHKLGCLYVEYICNSLHGSVHGVSQNDAEGMRRRLEINE